MRERGGQIPVELGEEVVLPPAGADVDDEDTYWLEHTAELSDKRRIDREQA